MVDYSKLSLDELHSICIDTLDYRNEGSFVEAFCIAFIKADQNNKIILSDVCKQLFEKYKLHRYTDDSGRLLPHHAKKHIQK